MTYDTIHLRDEALIASDYYQQLEWFERAVDEAHAATVARAYEMLNDVMVMLDDRDNLTNRQRVELLRILHAVKDEINNLKWSQTCDSDTGI